MLRVTTMESLKLTYWNPARNMQSVLEDIKVRLIKTNLKYVVF